MNKKKIIGLFIAGLLLQNSMTVLAAPETMPDGAVFDAAYYAAAYPDVSAAVGTSVDALYSHYLTYGRFEGRHPVAPPENETAGKGSAARAASVLSNSAVNGNPYAGKTITTPASGLTVDGLSYPVNSMVALGNGTVLQYGGDRNIYGGYVTAGVSGNTLVICYDLLTSPNGTDFQRLPAGTEYIIFVRNAATSKIAGIFTNTATGNFIFPQNGGSQTFDINNPNCVWVIGDDNKLTADGVLANGNYYVTVGPTTMSTLVASNIFTINH